MATSCEPDHHPDTQHAHGDSRKSLKSQLKLALLLSLGLLVIELIGGYWSHSLSLMADAAHVFADMFAIGMTLMTSWLAESPRTSRRSFGYYRLEILSALFNGCLLLFTTYFIFRSAIERWNSPVEIHSIEMLSISIFGLLINFIMLFLLKSKHSHQHMNLHSAYLHVLGDTLSSVAVVIGAIVIQLTGFNKADIIASLIVAIMIVAMSVRLVFDSVHILLEGTPREFDPDQIQKDIKSQFSQILDIHDFHIWEITSHLPAMTAHIEAKIESLTESQKLIEEINVMLKKNYGIRHTTFQIEARG